MPRTNHPIRSLITRREQIVCAMFWFDRLTMRQIAQRLAPESASQKVLRQKFKMVDRRIERAKAKLRAAGIPIPKRPRKLKVRNFTSAGLYGQNDG